MRCSSCQTDNRPGVRFCEECGTALERPCPACGAAVPADRKFCGACGASLAGAAPAAPGRPGSPQVLPSPPATGDVRSASPRAYTPPHLAERILRDRAALRGERKQVTVLFADVSGFTAMSEQLDPEDVHALINRAFELMLAEIHRYEGTVNQFLGDGLMALFGAPIAHEDHARRAAHAALGIQAVLRGYREELRQARGIDFLVRMGLNTGPVVVGAIGDNLRMDYTAVGDTTNTAARMLQLAEPGRIVMAEATERLVGPYFELRQLGTFTVRNRARPVAAWELLRARGQVTRLAARVSHGLTPFVGREDALGTLQRAFAAARAGRGQVVFVVGDAGIGKSRLLLEFREQVAGQVTWIEGNCISFGQSIPFLPVVEMLRRNFRIEDHDDEAEVAAKVERGIAALGDEARGAAPYLRYLLSVDPGDPAVTAMDPAERRARVVAAVARLTAAGSRRRPVVLVVEDAHWIDSASEDLLRSLAESLAGMAVLLIVTYRPVYQQPFGDRTYYWRIALRPVDDADAVRIVRVTLGVEDLPEDLAATIARKAEGNPFFLEEIGRALVEAGAVRSEGGRRVLTRAAAAIAVPDTVQDVIAARLDRLDASQKRTVQTAAVIGREFALGLLRRVSDLQEQLERSLGELKRIELIYEKAGLGEPEYVFRHALTQDVAYASLLQAERRRLHALIGQAIEDLHAGRLDEHVEELVYHFRRGEVWDRVLRYARDAAERAAALCVDERALEFYETALEALRHLPETDETARAGIEVRLAMRAPLWRGGQPERLAALLREAEALAVRHGDSTSLDTIWAFLVQYHWARGEQDQALDYAARCLERARARDNLGLLVTGLFYSIHAQAALGRYQEALRTARDLLDRLEGARATERFGLSGIPYSGACAYAAECLAYLGDVDGALRMIEQGRRVADAANHLYSQMVVAAAHGEVLVAAGRAAEAVEVLERAATVCRQKNFLGQLVNSLRHLGQAYVLAGRPADALAALDESIALQEKAGVSVARSSKHLWRSRAYLDLGDLGRAEEALGACLEFAERQGERGVEGWARLLGAELALRRSDRGEAARWLDEAQAIAEELAMAPLLERCRAVIGRLG